MIIALFAASILQRYIIILFAYDYDIQFMKTENKSIADCPSTLPMTEIIRVNQIDYSHIFHLTENSPI